MVRAQGTCEAGGSQAKKQADLGSVRGLSGICPGSVWGLSAICLGSVQDLSGICPAAVR